MRILGGPILYDLNWYQSTLKLIKNHQYYTQSQKKLREKGKQKNIKQLLNKLKKIEKMEGAVNNPDNVKLKNKVSL